MKKQIVWILLSSLSFILGSCGGSPASSTKSLESSSSSASSSSSGSSSHTHSFETVVTEPTCTEGGYTTYTCTVCGYTYKDNFTDPLGHISDVDWHHDETKHWHLCTRCGEKVEESQHEFGEGIITAPTCTEGGYTTYTCTVCGYSYQDNLTEATGHNSDGVWHNDETSHWHLCSVCGEEFDKTEHSFGDATITKESTYDEAGTETMTCSVCSYVKTEALPLKSPEAIEIASIGYTTNTVIQCQLSEALPSISSDEEFTGDSLKHLTATINGTAYVPSLLKYWADPHILQFETMGYTPTLGDIFMVAADSYFEVDGIRYALKHELSCYFNSSDVATGVWKQLTGGNISLAYNYGTASALMLKSADEANKISLPAIGENSDYNLTDYCVLSLLKNGTSYTAPRVWYYVNEGDGVISFDNATYIANDVIIIKKGSVIGNGLSLVYVISQDCSFTFDGNNWSVS